MKTTLCAACCLVLAACSGGGSGGSASPPPPPPPPPPPASSPSASSVFALADPGDPRATLDALAADSRVEGIAFRTTWGLLEPQDGAYDWSALDTALEVARNRGKKLTLHVGATGFGLPRWLTGLGVATYSFALRNGQRTTDPVPWDATYLARYGRFVQAMAAHIRSRGDESLLRAVSDGVPVSEMSLPGCRDGRLENGPAYSRAAYLEAWRTSGASHLAAFPSTPIAVSAPVAVICAPDQDGRAFYTELMAPLSERVVVFAADLNAEGSQRMSQVDASISSRGVLFQTIWSQSDDPENRMRGTLRDAVCRGLAFGARYFEIYKADLASADAGVRDAIEKARAGRC